MCPIPFAGYWNRPAALPGPVPGPSRLWSNGPGRLACWWSLPAIAMSNRFRGESGKRPKLLTGGEQIALFFSRFPTERKGSPSPGQERRVRSAPGPGPGPGKASKRREGFDCSRLHSLMDRFACRWIPRLPQIFSLVVSLIDNHFRDYRGCCSADRDFAYHTKYTPSQ